MRFNKCAIILVTAFVTLTPFVFAREPQLSADGLFAKFTTNRGDLLFSLDYEGSPLGVSLFLSIVSEGDSSPYTSKYFGREVKKHAVFGGTDIFSSFAQQQNTTPWEVPILDFEESGILALYGTGSRVYGETFFITKTADPNLEKHHLPIGKIVNGNKVLRSLRKGDRIHEIAIESVGEDAEAFLDEKDKVARLTELMVSRDIDRLIANHPELEWIFSDYEGNIKKHPGGFYYVVENEGDGEPPEQGAVVGLSYTGSFTDGRVFDSSRKKDPVSGELREELAYFSLGVDQMIPAVAVSLSDMRNNEERLLIIPPELGYGEGGVPGTIPPNSWLVFQMRLIAE